ncbi:MAG: hypothetical protein J7M24_00585 [Candidatus Latescibacteria bacterium]|nr:hypothetical protein [Candidatus Latescibacterota bacterium]
MKFRNNAHFHPIIFLVLAVVMIGGCGMYELDSLWRDREISIDGVDEGSEWEHARFFIEEENLTIGVMNDENMLYVRLSTRDRNLQRQLLAAGCTVWFDGGGGRDKSLGVHFPLGVQSSQHRMPSPGNSDTRTESDKRVKETIDSIQKSVEVIGPRKKERTTLSVGEAAEYGILCRIGNTKGNLVYELQMPLTRDESNPYGIGTTSEEFVGVGFETGELAVSARRRNPNGRNGGMVGGRGVGMGGGRTGGMGGVGRRGGRSGGMGGIDGRTPGVIPQTSLEMWLKARLATAELYGEVTTTEQ